MFLWLEYVAAIKYFFCIMFLLGGVADRVMQSLCVILFIYKKCVPGLLATLKKKKKKNNQQ